MADQISETVPFQTENSVLQRIHKIRLNRVQEMLPEVDLDIKHLNPIQLGELESKLRDIEVSVGRYLINLPFNDVLENLSLNPESSPADNLEVYLFGVLDKSDIDVRLANTNWLETSLKGNYGIDTNMARPIVNALAKNAVYKRTGEILKQLNLVSKEITEG